MNDLHRPHRNAPLAVFAHVLINVTHCAEIRGFAQSEFKMRANLAVSGICAGKADVDIVGRMHGLPHARSRSLDQGDNAVPPCGIFKSRSFEPGIAGKALRHDGVVIIVGRTKIHRNQILKGGPVFQFCDAFFQRRHVSTPSLTIHMINAHDPVNT